MASHRTVQYFSMVREVPLAERPQEMEVLMGLCVFLSPRLTLRARFLLL